MQGATTALHATVTLLVWWAVWSLLDHTLVVSPWPELAVLVACGITLSVEVQCRQRRQRSERAHGHKPLINSEHASLTKDAGTLPLSEAHEDPPHPQHHGQGKDPPSIGADLRVVHSSCDETGPP